MLFENFFQIGSPAGPILVGTYNPPLVMLSVLIAMFASAMALQMIGHFSHMSGRATRFLIPFAGSVALGCGVWSMHFIGMLSFDLCTPVEYDKTLTLLSILPSFAASAIALSFLRRSHVSAGPLIVGGILVGAGIGAMHYAGMAAMKMSALLRYDPWYFSLSIVVAIVLATLALWIRYGLQSLGFRLSDNWRTVIGGCVMGIAISGMHYTGMQAARFTGNDETVLAKATSEPTFLALAVSFITISFSGLVVAVNGLMKYRDLLINQKKFRILSEFSSDAHLIFDESGIIECNPAAVQILGASSRMELLGLHPARFSPERQKRRS